MSKEKVQGVPRQDQVTGETTTDDYVELLPIERWSALR